MSVLVYHQIFIYGTWIQSSSNFHVSQNIVLFIFPPVVNVRNVQTCRAFSWVLLSQTDDCCWEAKPQWIEEVLWKMVVLPLNFSFNPHSRTFFHCFFGALTSVAQLVGRKMKGYQFNSWSGHLPGVWVWSWSGLIWVATDRCFSLTLMFLSLSFSFPSPLSKINI